MDYYLSSFGISPIRLSILAAMYIILLLITSAIGLFFFYLRAAGLYEMSKIAGIDKPWYSFIPVLQVVSLGRLSGAGRKGKSGRALTAAYILFLLAGLVFIILSLSGMIQVVFALDAKLEAGDESALDAVKYLAPMIFAGIAFIVIGIIYAVLRYIALWRIYSSFAKEKAVLFLILSILFDGILDAVFLFSIRKNAFPDLRDGIFDTEQ